MISILPWLKNMSSNDKVTQLEAELWKVRANKAKHKAMEEQQITPEKVAAEVKRVTEEKAVSEVRWVAEEEHVGLSSKLL